MTRNDFIFSNKVSYRVARHLVFWAVYCLYFWVQSISPESTKDFLQPQTYKNAFISLYCFIPVCIFSVYISLYFIFPYFIQKKRYAGFVLTFLALLLIDIFLNYFFSTLFYNNVVYTTWYKKSFFGIFSLGHLNSIWAIIVSTFAIGIRLTKNWYRQQKENLEIAGKKASTNLKLEKSVVRPEFLSRSLNSIYDKINSGSNDAPMMVLKLSDLLNYALYNAEVERVPIDQEVSALNDLIFFEKKRNGFANIQLHHSNDLSAIYIPPTIILSILQESIARLNLTTIKSFPVILDISCRDQWLYIQLAFHHLNKTIINIVNFPGIIQNMRKRLDALYEPENYQLQITEDKEETLVTLTLILKNTTSAGNNILKRETNEGVYEPA